MTKVTGFGTSINRRRLLSVYCDIGASSALLQQHTGWQPAGALLERLNKEADGIQGEPVNVENRVLVANKGKVGACPCSQTDGLSFQ